MVFITNARGVAAFNATYERNIRYIVLVLARLILLVLPVLSQFPDNRPVSAVPKLYTGRVLDVSLLLTDIRINNNYVA